jgi:hypothetical protein
VSARRITSHGGRDSSSERGRTLARGNVVLSIFGTGVGNFPFTLTRLTVGSIPTLIRLLP